MSRVAWVIGIVVMLLSGAGFSCSNEDADQNVGDEVKTPRESVKRPTEIIQVQPSEGSQACLTPTIVVSFRLTDVMREGGAIARHRFELTVDGMDVTKKLEIRGTLDFPQSRADLLYHPEQSLSPGQHNIAVAYPKEASKREIYHWSFIAVQTSCQP